MPFTDTEATSQACATALSFYAQFRKASAQILGGRYRADKTVLRQKYAELVAAQAADEGVAPLRSIDGFAPPTVAITVQEDISNRPTPVADG